MRYVLTVLFLSTILAANYATTHWGMIPVGFGLIATAGTLFAGLAFVLRDELQRNAGKAFTLAAIGAGAVLSFLIADPFIALASAVAFAVSEALDMAVWTKLQDRGYVRAAVASNTVGAFVDTVLFLWVAGFPVWSGTPGQMVAKVAVTLATVAIRVAIAGRRKPAYTMELLTVTGPDGRECVVGREFRTNA